MDYLSGYEGYGLMYDHWIVETAISWCVSVAVLWYLYRDTQDKD